ncbi:DNA-binding protein [Phreatobacter aquaticus]|uniref:DNA-binding protein n=1 Tax=Phreatobacter aquaticus TaxID=2570229 RepID=A0A4D7QKB0_9HYPH|nr:AAA family ATPase [Phreatobacter aquaticus]QCK85677.1 DNA-binding protein [Phreatobacter aquaticus]
MKISALRLHNVKRFAGRGVAIEGIGDGVNVLCAANEFGKSTSFEALHALFFQPHSGVPKEVRRLQPYSGGNPLVEADIVTAGGQFRLTKQFIGGKRATVTEIASGRLVAQQDEAERFIADLVHGGTAGPAGMLWVRQGITGLEERSRSDEEGDRRVRESLLTSVQGEVEAVTGGRRMAAIMEAASEELGRFATPTLKPKAGGPYAAAAEDLARLLAQEKRLEKDVADLRDALDRRLMATRRLTELDAPEEKASRRAAVVTAEAALQKARAHSDALKAREAETALARDRLAKADRELTAFRDALTRAATLSHELGQAAEQRGALRARRAECQAAIDTASALAKAAEAEQRAARDLLARLDAAMKARQAMEDLLVRRERLTEAETVRQSLEAGEAELARLAMPEDAIDRLQKLDMEIARLRASAEAGLPSVRLDYQPGASAVLADGVPLADGVDRSVPDNLVLTLPGIGTLTLRSNRPAGADAALTKAVAGRQSLLATLGVDDLPAAQQRQAEARDKAGSVASLRLQLRLLAPEGVPALRADVARLEAIAPADIELKGDPDAAREAVAKADLQVDAARNAEREAGPSLSRAQDAEGQAEAAYVRLNGELSGLEALLGPAEARMAREQALAAERASQQIQVDQLDMQLTGLREHAPSVEAIEASLQRVRSIEDGAAREAAALREQLAELNGQIRSRSDDAVEESWRETKDQREAAEARVAAFETEVAVLDRLKAVLQQARSAARDLYLKPVLTELRPLLGMLFDDVSIVFDEKTLLPQSIRRNGQDEDIDRLSGGMREQLSILTRLAFARLLARDGRAAPVILDDALVYSDDDRIERMFDALHRQAREQQIIVFSCRQRAFARLGGHVLHMTDWVPDAAAR